MTARKRSLIDHHRSGKVRVEGQLHRSQVQLREKMIHIRNIFALVLLASVSTMFAQSSEVSIQSPPPPKYVGHILKPFHLERRVVAPAKLANSPRLESLVRGGNLYLSVQDVIALALENNLDIAVQRYSPFLASEVLRRAEGGGFLRPVDTPVAAGPTSVSTAGISTNGNGVLGGGGGLSGGGGIVSQIGPVPPSLDPNMFLSVNVGHNTTPQTNTLFNHTTALTKATAVRVSVSQSSLPALAIA